MYSGSNPFCSNRPRAAASANDPPEPIPINPSSGSRTSPVPSAPVTHQHRPPPSCFEAAQIPVRPPVLGKLNAGPGQLARICSNFNRSNRVKASAVAPESSDHTAVAQREPRAFDFMTVSERHLTVAGDNYLTVLANRKNCRAVPGRNVTIFIGLRTARVGRTLHVAAFKMMFRQRRQDLPATGLAGATSGARSISK